MCRLQLAVDNGEGGAECLGAHVSASLVGLISSNGATVGDPRVITWESLQHLQQECKEDRVMVNLADQIRRGFPDSGY